MRSAWKCLAFAAGALLAAAQVSAPVAAPEPAFAISSDPEAVYRRLLSANASERVLAFETLGLSGGFVDESMPREVTLRAVNIDSDPDLERILTVSGNRFTTVAVFDLEESSWRQIGFFLCCGINASTNRDPFVELKQTVGYGTNDLIVHSGGSQGTGVGELRVSICRAWKGRLYKVFETVEGVYNSTASEESKVLYARNDASSPMIHVQRTRKAHGRSTITCASHRWDARTFQFAPMASSPGACKSP